MTTEPLSTPGRGPNHQAHWERQLAAMHASLLEGRDVAIEAIGRLESLAGQSEPGPRAEATRGIDDACRLLEAWRVEHVEECLHALALNRPSSIELRLAIQLTQAAWDLAELCRHAQRAAAAGRGLPSGLEPAAHDLGEGLRAATDALAHLDPSAGRTAVARVQRARDATSRAFGANPSASGGSSLLTLASAFDGIADRVAAIAERVLETAEGYGDTAPPEPESGLDGVDDLDDA
ncbi:MAG: hypothetical protein AAF288_06650 [Planctomycetota bacterium]